MGKEKRPQQRDKLELGGCRLVCQMRINELETKLAAREAEINTCRHEFHMLQEEQSRLEEEHHYFQEEYYRLQEKNDRLKEKYDRLQEEQTRLQEEHDNLQDKMDLIYTTGLFGYLPEDKKQPDRFYRNEAIHGARVNYDLRFLRSVSHRHQEFLRDHNLTISDLDEAFKRRYGHYPTELTESSIIPEEMANIINMKSDLKNLTFWKRAKCEYVSLRKKPRKKCDSVIHKWVNPRKDHPYSSQSTEKIFTDLSAQYWS